jgi:hypothetical protein
MPDDHIRYDVLTQAALRGVVRTVLAGVAKTGMPSGHNFNINFNTRTPGVWLSDRIRAQYPKEMTIVLQHQFWDLRVTDKAVEVGLAFGGIPEQLVIPFDAITAFYDSAAQFGFQFDTTDKPAADDLSAARPSDKAAATSAVRPPVAPSKSDVLPAPTEPAPEPPRAETGGGEVVRLDRFRKK